MDYKRYFFLCVCLIVFILNSYSNFFGLIREDKFDGFDLFDESFITGRLAKSEKDGIFSEAGFPGVNYDKETVAAKNIDKLSMKDRSDVVLEVRNSQLSYYAGEEKTPQEYFPYLSQPGGQGIFFSCLSKISPFDNLTNFKIFKFINVLLLAICFVLFISWCYRNFSFLSAFAVFFFLSVSPFIINIGSLIWWSLWALYLPFITVLLLMERKYNYPQSLSYLRILILTSLAFFIKCIFTGFEFAPTIVFSILPPVVYYFYLKKETISSFLIFSFKMMISSAIACSAGMVVLITQLRFYFGSWAEALDYVVSSFLRRASLEHAENVMPENALSLIFKKYLKGNAFDLYFLEKWNISIPYIAVFALVFLSVVVVFWYYKKKNPDRKYVALLLTFFISFVCPYSWFFIFKEHALVHLHIDYIVWYIPCLLFGFLIIGTALNMLINQLRYFWGKRSVA